MFPKILDDDCIVLVLDIILGFIASSPNKTGTCVCILDFRWLFLVFHVNV